MSNAVTFKDLKSSFLKERNTSIPQEAVELPSCRKRATIRPMTVKEQREILKSLEKKDEFLVNQSFDSLLERCVINIDGEPYDNDKVVIQDRTFLLLKIRQLTTGDVAKINHVCPKTGDLVPDIEVNLKECLRVKYFDGGKIEKVLTLSPTVKLTLGPATRKDERDLDNWARRKENKESVIDRRYAAYATLIKQIELKDESGGFVVVPADFSNKIEFITDCCTQKDTDQIDEYIKGLDFGVTVKFKFKYKDYENEEEEANIISFFIM